MTPGITTGAECTLTHAGSYIITAISFHSTLGDKQETVLKQVHKLVLSRAFEKLVDFDNHLDNIEMDWTNPAVGPALENTKEE